MAQLLIADLDNAVEERLMRRALRHGHSLEAEVCSILKDAVREEPSESGLREEGAPMLRNGEKGLGELMVEHFKDRGLTDEEFVRFNAGIAEINSRSAMRIPDFRR